MKQFIRYLYEYQDGRRIRNVGFVKVEQADASTVVHIHGKGLHLAGDRKLKVYIFYMEEGQCIGIWQGDIENVNPAVNYRLTFTPEDTGRVCLYPRIEGIILENGGCRRFAAVWNDMPVAVEKMRLWKDEPEPDLAELLQQNAAGAQEDPAEKAGEETGIFTDGQKISDAGQQDKDRNICCMKIRRRDIAQLKRCEWRLANNSFLLHGYYSYHHLLLVQEEDQWLLGVPGIYHPREAQAAEAFGFPRFLRIDEQAVELGEDEQNRDDDFGYWCRPVRR